jgi:hypothetical protein
MAAILAEM